MPGRTGQITQRNNSVINNNLNSHQSGAQIQSFYTLGRTFILTQITPLDAHFWTHFLDAVYPLVWMQDAQTHGRILPVPPGYSVFRRDSWEIEGETERR